MTSTQSTGSPATTPNQPPDGTNSAAASAVLSLGDASVTVRLTKEHANQDQASTTQKSDEPGAPAAQPLDPAGLAATPSTTAITSSSGIDFVKLASDSALELKPGLTVTLNVDSYTVTAVRAGSPAATIAVTVPFADLSADAASQTAEAKLAQQLSSLSKIDLASFDSTAPLKSAGFNSLLKSGAKSVEISGLSNADIAKGLLTIKADTVSLANSTLANTYISIEAKQYLLSGVKLENGTLAIRSRSSSGEISGELVGCYFAVDTILAGNLGSVLIRESTTIKSSAPNCNFTGATWEGLSETPDAIRAFKDRNIGFVYRDDLASELLLKTSAIISVDEFTTRVADNFKSEATGWVKKARHSLEAEKITELLAREPSATVRPHAPKQEAIAPLAHAASNPTDPAPATTVTEIVASTGTEAGAAPATADVSPTEKPKGTEALVAEDETPPEVPPSDAEPATADEPIAPPGSSTDASLQPRRRPSLLRRVGIPTAVAVVAGGAILAAFSGRGTKPTSTTDDKGSPDQTALVVPASPRVEPAPASTQVSAESAPAAATLADVTAPKVPEAAATEAAVAQPVPPPPAVTAQLNEPAEQTAMTPVEPPPAIEPAATIPSTTPAQAAATPAPTPIVETKPLEPAPIPALAEAMLPSRTETGNKDNIAREVSRELREAFTPKPSSASAPVDPTNGAARQVSKELQGAFSGSPK
jgi:hypothetical protein